MTDIFPKSFLVDTNILVYLSDKNSQFYLPTLHFFEKSERENIKLVVAHQSILELTRTLVKDYQLNFTQATQKSRLITYDEKFEVIFPLYSTLHTYYKIAKNKNKIGNVFDLYLAATALDNGINNIVTNNPIDFTKIPNFKAFSLEELRTLGGKIRGEHE